MDHGWRNSNPIARTRFKWNGPFDCFGYAGAISYVAFSYVTDDVNVLSIDGVAPTDENVTTNDWKVWRMNTCIRRRTYSTDSRIPRVYPFG